MINPGDCRVMPETFDRYKVDLDAEVLDADDRRITEADTQEYTTARAADHR